MVVPSSLRSGPSGVPGCEVIILNWNTWGHIRRGVGKLSALAGREDVRITVVDNGSSQQDASFERDFPWVRVLRLADNIGYAGGNNVVLRECHAEYALLQNSDAFPTVAQIEHLLAIAASDPRIGAVGPALVDSTGVRQIGSYGYDPGLMRWAVEASGLTVLPGLGELGVWGRRVVSPEPMRDVVWVSGACMLVRMAAVREVGLLPDINFMYMEDTDWCARASGAGWRIVYVPSDPVIHLFGGSQPTDSSTWVETIMVYLEQHHGPAARVCIAAVGVVGSLWRALAALLLSMPSWDRRTFYRARARRFMAYTGGFARMVWRRGPSDAT